MSALQEGSVFYGVLVFLSTITSVLLATIPDDAVNYGYETLPDPAADAVFYHFSTTDGDPDNDALTPSTPKVDWWPDAQHGLLWQAGDPARIRMKRGDVWDVDQGNPELGNENSAGFENELTLRSGRSADEPQVLESYGPGTTRPLIRNGHIRNVGSHVRIHGIAMRRTAEDESIWGVAMVWDSNGPDTDVLIQDCDISFYALCIGVGPTVDDSAHAFTNCRVIKNILVNAYATGFSSQGVYFTHVYGMKIIGNVTDHNGWTDDNLAAQSILNHNYYIQYTCRDVEFHGNLDMRDCSGPQVRGTATTLQHNVYVNDGYVDMSGRITRYNLVIGGKNVADFIHGDGQPGCQALAFGTGVNNALASYDTFVDSAGGPVELNERRSTPFNFSGWEVAAADGSHGATGRAVCSDGLYMKSIVPGPVYVRWSRPELPDPPDPIQPWVEEEAEMNFIPMDSAIGIGAFAREVSGSNLATLYRYELYRDEFNHDWAAIVRRVAGVETDLVRTDLGLNFWNWGVDVLAVNFLGTVYGMRRGAPTNDGLGELLVEFDDSAITPITGFLGIVLPDVNCRIKTWEQHLQNSYNGYTDFYENMASFVNYRLDEVPPTPYGMVGGGTPNRLRVYRNLVSGYNIGWGMSSQTPLNECLYHHNEINQPGASGGRIVDAEPFIISPLWRLYANKYRVTGSSQWIMNSLAYSDPLRWRTDSREQAGVYMIGRVDSPYPNEGYNLLDYMTEIGDTPTMDRFYERAREMNSLVPGAGHDVIDIQNRFRAAFGRGRMPALAA